LPSKVSLERSWEFLSTVGNGVSNITRPCDQFLKEVCATLDEAEAGFKGLKDTIWSEYQRIPMMHKHIQHVKSTTHTWRRIQKPAQRPAMGQATNQRRMSQMIAKMGFLDMV
jgi:hypothetical protein